MAMRILVSVLALILAGCSTLPAIGDVSGEDETWLLEGADLEGVRSAPPPAAAADALMALTPEMERFAERAVQGEFYDIGKVTALLQAIVSPGGMGLEYDQRATYTAAEAFEHARANCLSFTALFVALARHAGLDARFNEVDVPPIWDMHGSGTLVLYKHINAAVRVGRGHWKVVDIFPQEYDPSYPQRTISDQVATAQYYNNLAMEHLLEDRLPQAQRHMAAAISIDADVSYLWGNLGALYQRAGKTRAAELSLVKAIRVDARDYVAISNAARLYAQTGREEIARELEELAAYFQRQNPYYRYRQGVEALAQGRYEAAKDHTLAAIRLHDREHRFYFLLGAVYQQLGEAELARENFALAIELATDNDQELRYRRKAEMLLRATL